MVWRRGSPLSGSKNTFRSRWLAEADTVSLTTVPSIVGRILASSSTIADDKG